MNVFLWFFLFLIGVYDAREHRIPNILLVTIFLSEIFSIFLLDEFLDEELFYRLLIMLVVFISSLSCYLMGWMAPGDVKLISVVGFVVGADYLVDTIFWIGFFSVFIGLMYWAFNQLESNKQPFSINLFFNNLCQLKLRSRSNRLSDVCCLAVMPFAPVVVCGVALAQYMHFSV